MVPIDRFERKVNNFSSNLFCPRVLFAQYVKIFKMFSRNSRRTVSLRVSSSFSWLWHPWWLPHPTEYNLFQTFSDLKKKDSKWCNSGGEVKTREGFGSLWDPCTRVERGKNRSGLNHMINICFTKDNDKTWSCWIMSSIDRRGRGFY